MLLVVIIACEVLFWLLLLGGLAVRYLLRRRRIGAVLIAGVPLTDLVLFVATILHLRSGATPNITDGLAAAYIGVSVAFGPGIVRRMDARFAYRVGAGPIPPRPPKYGKEKARHEWREFGKAALAWAISCVLLLGGVLLVGGAARGAVLLGWIGRLSMVLLIWLIFPISYEIWPSKPKPDSKPDSEQVR